MATEDSVGSVTSLFRQLQAGHVDSAGQLWARFSPRLLGLARRILARRELPLDAEDAVQTAFFQFFRRVEQGWIYGDPHRDELWSFLCMTTTRVARSQLRAERALKRGRNLTVRESEMATRSTSSAPLDDLLGSRYSPDSDLICEELLLQLKPDLQEIAVLKLAGYSNPEIKEITGYPVRSIQRRVALIRSQWKVHLNQP